MVTMENYEEYMLLEADGELTEAGQKELYAFLDQHPELKNELALYMATKLLPDERLVYDGKETLLKTTGGKRTINLGGWWMYGAVAACLAFVLFLLVKPENTPAPAVTIATNHNNRPAANNQPQVREELHSTPANPVTIKTKKAEVQPPAAIAKTKKQPAMQQVKQPLPLPVDPVHHNEQPIARQEITPVEKQEPETQKEKQETYVQAPEVIVPEPSPATEIKDDRKLLALLPEKKREGLSEIALAVNEKIEKVKKIKNKIKDTDISFRIGNRELFVVKL